MRSFITLLTLFLTASLSFAGYSQPSYIDGGQSMDGRYIVTASQVIDPKAGTKGGPAKPNPASGPFEWEFTWKDTKSNISKTFPAKGVQKGQIYAHLFVAPDGETFALFNGIILWEGTGKSDDHGTKVITDPANPGKIAADKRTHEALSRRLIVYKKDGTIIKELAVNDFLKEEDWGLVLAVFNRAHWIIDYAPLSYRSTPRSGYALYQISPDYTVIEFKVPTKDKKNRTIWVDLITGNQLTTDPKPADKNKIPVRPFVGPNALTELTPKEREGYVPSLDPVRIEGKYVSDKSTPDAKPETPTKPTLPTYTPLTLIKDGFKKLDTPTWIASEKAVLACDLESGKLHKFVGKEVSELREGRRGKLGPDGKYYGILDGKLVSWTLSSSEKPTVILEKGTDGKDLSLNDLTIGANGLLYFTTLKDPEKGRVTVVDTAKKTAKVVYDAETLNELINPNGIALSPDGKYLYVGVSNYKDRKKSGIYRLSIGENNTVDVEAGKAKKWAEINAPDGIAFGPDGNLYATAGGIVAIVNAEGKKIGEVKIPKGSGTNLCFGGEDGKTLFVTTDTSLYSTTLK